MEDRGRDDSGWTVRTAKVYLNEKIEADRRTGRERFLFLVGLGVFVWFELQRRLLGLNHAHEQHEDTLARSVTSDKYDSDKTATNVRLNAIETKMTAGEARERATIEETARTAAALALSQSQSTGAVEQQQRSRGLVISGVAVVVTIVAVALSIYVARQKPTVVTPTAPTVTVTVPTPTTP